MFNNKHPPSPTCQEETPLHLFEGSILFDIIDKENYDGSYNTIIRPERQAW